MYSIKQAAELTGMSAYTLRYYEKIGLIKYIYRDKNGIRSYTDEDIKNLQFLKIIKETGMPLEVIKDFFDEGCIVKDIENGKDMSEVLEKRVRLLEKQTVQLQEKQREIEAVLSFAYSKKQLYVNLLKK